MSQAGEVWEVGWIKMQEQMGHINDYIREGKQGNVTLVHSHKFVLVPSQGFSFYLLVIFIV